MKMKTPAAPIYSDQHAFPSFLNLRSAHTTPVVINTINAFEIDAVVLVRATSAEGLTGVVTCNSRAIHLLGILRDLVVPVFIGRDVREIESLVNEVYTHKSNYKYQGTPFWNCVAYVEAALLDLLGKVAQKTVGELLGTVYRKQLDVYLSCMKRDNSPEEEVNRLARGVHETGAKAVKYKIGGRMSHNADSIPGRSDTLIPLVRERLGEGVTLYADGNGSYDSEHAIETGHRLEDYNYAWFEEPCPFEEYEGTRQVANALKIKVAGGEQDCNLAMFRRMAAERIVDVLQPDLMYVGGLIRALRAARIAGEAGMNVAPHSPKHNPELATLLHFASIVENMEPFIEFPIANVQYHSWYHPHFTLQPGGVLQVPEGPGLGVTYDTAIWKTARRLF